jgi:porin
MRFITGSGFAFLSLPAMKPLFLTFAFMAFAECIGYAQTSPADRGPGSPSQPPDFWSQDYLTGNWGGLRDELKKDGLQITPNFTEEIFGNPSGGFGQGVVFPGVLEVPVDLDFDPLTNGAVKDLTFHVNGLYIYGNNLSTRDVGDFSTLSNIVAYNTVRLQDLWLQKLLWDKKLSIRAGNLDIDTEFFQCNSSLIFASSTFGAFTLLANNIVNPPTYPLAAPGVRLQFSPTAQTYVMAGVYGRDDDGNPATTNRNGIRFALDTHDGVLVMSEAGYLLNQGPNDKGLPGTYRIGSFLDTDNHTTWASQAQFANGTGPLQSAGTNYGVYGIMDQQLYSHDCESISFFVRGASAPSNTNFVDWYVDGGFNFTGFIPGRANDCAGLGVARSHVSKDFSESQVAQGNPPSSAETVIEATYKIQLAPWWTLQPDFQYIINPSGVDGSNNATVLGLRTIVNF